MTKTEKKMRIELVLARFDFKKVEDSMRRLEMLVGDDELSIAPTAELLKQKALKLLESVAKNRSSHCSVLCDGLRAEKWEKHFMLSFVPTTSDSHVY